MAAGRLYVQADETSLPVSAVSHPLLPPGYVQANPAMYGGSSTGAESARRNRVLRGRVIRASATPRGTPSAEERSAVPIPRSAVLESRARCRASSAIAEYA